MYKEKVWWFCCFLVAIGQNDGLVVMGLYDNDDLMFFSMTDFFYLKNFLPSLKKKKFLFRVLPQKNFFIEGGI